MDLSLELLAKGIVQGAVYVVLGLSFGLIFNTTRVFHFAHGAVYAAAAYAIYLGLARWHLSVALTLAGTAIVAAALGAGCEVFVYRPMRDAGAPALLQFLASFAILLLGQNVLLMVFGGVPLPLSNHISPAIQIGFIRLVELDLVKIVCALAVLGFILLYLFGTRFGLITRSLVANPFMASVVGIDRNLFYAFTYALGSILVVPAAFVDASASGASPSLGAAPMLLATIVVFSGGVGVIPAAALSGLLLGVIESLSALWVPLQWQTTFALAVLLAFLMVRPQGLFGRTARRI